MANERNTEQIVRDILRNKGYYDDTTIQIEEQASSNKTIKKLLSNASKSGKGNIGYPEFIISFTNRPNDIVVVECKAATTQHESSNKENFESNAKDYAVDGVLWYASFLKDEYNVTAIAVSGENDREKKISSFLWLKENFTFIETQEEIFPSPDEVTEILLDQQKPFSHEDLVKKANEYNDELDSYSIPEIERCTLMSAILVALQHRPFCSSYLDYKHDQNKDLIESLLNACRSVLKSKQLDKNKVEVILNEYSRFKLSAKFTSEKIYKNKQEVPNTILRDFVKNIHKEILPYIQNNEFDILGQFYTIFIKYAGSDKKTGLVLTPTHITDFFCDISGLNKDDILLDTCCGTAGFLVSGMNYMLKDAGFDSAKRKKIKTRQLVGIEVRQDMFAHACSNMMMRGDGKSHIYYGDCFRDTIKNEILKHRATKAFLNPPYRKGNNAEQLEFLENALECLVKGGIGIAICKMGVVVSSKKDVRKVKERLLSKHTLLGVLTMPNELFNPAASVPTTIIIFESNQPHPTGFKTFFGYYKDDGFTVNNNKRTDSKGLWEGIKKQWLNAYMNKESIIGLSVLHEVKPDDEWIAEAYMLTDYSTLNKDDFGDTIKEYISYKVKYDG